MGNQLKNYISSGKSSHLDFTLRPSGYILISYGGEVMLHASSARYLGAHVDQHLTYNEHVRVKRLELDRLHRIRWLLRYSAFSFSNKRLLYILSLPLH